MNGGVANNAVLIGMLASHRVSFYTEAIELFYFHALRALGYVR